MDPKLKEQMAAFQRRADKEPWLPWLGAAPFLDAGGCLLMIISFIAIWSGFLLFYVSLGVGIACSVVGFRDNGIRCARITRDAMAEIRQRLGDPKIEFNRLKQEVHAALSGDQYEYSDLCDFTVLLQDHTMMEAAGLLGEAWRKAEYVISNRDEWPEESQKLAEEVIFKLRRMRELAGL